MGRLRDLQELADWLAWKYGAGFLDRPDVKEELARLGVAGSEVTAAMETRALRKALKGLTEALYTGCCTACAVPALLDRRETMSAVTVSEYEARELFTQLGEKDAAEWKATKLQKRLERLTAGDNGNLHGEAKEIFDRVIEAQETGRPVQVEGAGVSEAAQGEYAEPPAPSEGITQTGSKPSKGKGKKGAKPATAPKKPTKVAAKGKKGAKPATTSTVERDEYGAKKGSERYWVGKMLSKAPQSAGDIAKAVADKSGTKAFQSNVKRYLDELVGAKKIKQTKEGYALK